MSGWTSYTYLWGPVAAFLAVGVLVLLLRWTFSSGTSLVARRPHAGVEGDYGLLVSVASPGTYVEGEMLRLRLERAGLRATLARTTDGPRLMVFAGDQTAARHVLAGTGRSGDQR